VTTPSNGQSANTLDVASGSLTVGGTMTMSGAGNGSRIGELKIGSGTVTVTGVVSTTGNANGKITFTGSGILNALSNLTFVNSACLTAGTGTINMKGTGAQTIGGASVTFNVLNINNAVGVSLGIAQTTTTLTIGDVTSNSIFNDAGFQLTSTGTLNLTSGTFKLGSAGTATTFPAFGTRNISSGTTVEYVAGVAQTVSSTPSYKNLTFSGAGTKTLASGTLTITENWTVGSTTSVNTNNPTINLTGNFNLNSGTFTSSASAAFNVAGNWVNNGTFTHNSGTVTLNGSSQQTITGSAVTTFNNLTISNTAGAILGSNQIINNTLSLTGGNFDVSNKVLTMGASAPAISGTFSSSRMIIADDGGTVRKNASSNATASYTFPIGDSSSSANGAEYTPVTLSITGSAYSSAYVEVSVNDGKHTNNASATHYLTRYWNVNQSGITACTATVTGTYLNTSADVTGTLGSVKAAQLNGTFNQTTNPWLKTGGSVLSGTTLTYSGAVITSGQTSVFTGITSADPTVNITGGGITTCFGVNVNLGTSVTGDGTILYNWTPATFLSSTTIATPVVTSPTTTTSYSVTITDGNGITATSASSTITVRPNFTSGTINTTGETICYGGTPASTIGSTTASSGGDNAITYSWRSSADGYTAAISGATSATYLPPAGLTTTTSYQRYANDGTCNTTPTVSTGTWIVTVYSTFTSGTIATTGETICYGGTPSVIGSVTASSGGDNVITYSWRSSADGYTAVISGATNDTYTPPSGLTTTTSYQRYANDGTCNTTPTVSTGTWTVTVRPEFTSGEISAAGETICNGGNPSVIGSVTPASGGDNTISYQWQANGSDIIGANSATYDPPSGLTATTTYTRLAKDGTCNTTYTAATGSWVVTVQSVPTAGVINSAQTICYNTVPSGLTDAVSGTGTGTLSYRWEVNTNLSTPSWSIISGETTATYTPGVLTATTQYRRTTISTLNGVVCESVPTSVVQITVRPDFTSGEIVTTGETICNGGDPSVIGSIAVASGGDNTITYQWQADNVDIIGANSATYDPPSGLTATTTYTRYAKDGTCNTTFELSTGSWVVTVQSVPTAGSIDTAQTICYNTTPVGLTSAVDGTVDGTISYRWESSISPFSSWSTIGGATSATYAPGALTVTTQYRRITISDLNGVLCESVPTATVQITVYPNFTSGAINTSGETICYGGDPIIISSVTDASGGDGSISYQWQADNVDIFGATGATYDPPIGLIATTTYTRYAKDDTCNTTLELSTGSWTVTVRPNFTPGEISATGETICNGGDPSAIGSVTAASGGDGNIIYQWQANNVDIFGATGATYDPPSGLTATTTYTRFAKDGTCNTTFELATGSWVVTVQGVPTAGSIDAAQTICYDTIPLGLTDAVSGTGDGDITYRWELNTNLSTPSWSTISGEIDATYTPGSLTVTTQYRRFTVSTLNSIVCESVPTAIIQITVDPLSVGGTVTGGVATCSGSTSGLLTLSGHTGDVVRWESSVSPFTTWTDEGNAGSTTFTSGTITETTRFRAVVQSGVCTEENSVETEVLIETTTWDGSTWDNGVPNDGVKAAIISGDFTSSGTNINACTLTVTNNAVVVISSLDTVTLSGAITVDTGCSVTFNNNANLMQGGTVNTNSGSIAVKRASSALTRLDYTLWSSPVSGSQSLLNFSPYTYNLPPNNVRFYKYNTNTNAYYSVNPSTTNFEQAKGYLIRMPNTYPNDIPTIWTGRFAGIPNNGDIIYTMEDYGIGKRFNLVGNPYPSPISAVDFVNEATNGNNITGTLYFWRKTNNPLSPSYCSWSTLGFTSNGEAQVFNPNDIIQTGQGFFVEGIGSGNVNGHILNFNNSMRRDNHANQFFKTVNPIEKHRIWLNASNTKGAFSQTLVGYMTNATQAYDAKIDGKYINDGDIALTSLIETTAYEIQGRALPFKRSDVVPLSFKATTAGTYSIAIDHFDGVFSANNNIYLRDNTTGVLHDLKTSAYSFTSGAGTFASRFELVYRCSVNVTTVTACDSYTWNGVVYTHSGLYTGPMDGCIDQQLDLTIIPSSENVTKIVACDSYTWNGTTYTSSGVYAKVPVNCVTEKLDLTIIPSSIHTTKVIACDSYTWGDHIYTETGIYTGATHECITEKLDLTIIPSSIHTTKVVACDSYTWGDHVYTETGIYTGTTHECITEKLDLTIIPSSIHTTKVIACDSYTWGDHVYTETGIYTGATHECITEKLDLTIIPSSTHTTEVIANNSYTWSVNNQTYLESGNYTHTSECVTEILKLTINSLSIDQPEINSFRVLAYPNPFAHNFELILKSNNIEPVDLKVYDVLGRMIEQARFEFIDSDNMTFGANYSSGIYNIIVTQGTFERTLRVIKK
jgi:hypothetical protein